MFIPKQVFFTKGVGVSKNELESFEKALRMAKIEKQNLVQVSSILPPNCIVTTRNEGLKHLSPGQITFCVMSRCSSNEHGRLLAASVGCAIPTDKNSYGYLSEAHIYGKNEKDAGDFAEDLAVSMLGSTLGIDIDEDLGWDEKKEIYKMNNKIIKTTNITQSAVAKGRGSYTTVLSAAVFILY